MILRPLLGGDSVLPTTAVDVEPVWPAIARTQAVEAQQYLLIAQPDHARLSGELSALFRCDFLPEIDEVISKIIAVHDDGWARIPFEGDLRGDPPRTNTGRPQHFLQVTVQDSLVAWTGSIKAAGAISRLGEYMVSMHFLRIGRMRIQMDVDTPDDMQRLREFVRGEENREARHEPEIGLPKEQLLEYVDLLQFCDVLSLYLCCGSAQPVEFPQQFRGHQVQVRYRDGVYQTSPSLFGGKLHSFYLPARVYPSSVYPSADGEEQTTLTFQLK